MHTFIKKVILLNIAQELLTTLKPIVTYCIKFTSALKKAEKCKEEAELVTGRVRAMLSSRYVSSKASRYSQLIYMQTKQLTEFIACKVTVKFRLELKLWMWQAIVLHLNHFIKILGLTKIYIHV